jgi:small subunit ribosomal protein S2
MTNFVTIRTRVQRMEELEAMQADGRMELLPKKEQILLGKELAKLQVNLNGIRNLRRTPDAIFVIDTNREEIAIKEAKRLGIPVVAIVDSNCNPDLVDYVVPGNDDALRSIKVLMDTMAASIEDGLHEIKRDAAPAETPDKDEAPAEAAAEEK